MFVFDKNILDRLDNTEDARVTFLHDRISQLHEEAGEHGSGLFVTHGDPVEVLASLAASGQVRAVYTNEDYEPYAQTRDAEVQANLGQHGVAFHTFTDHVIQAPGEVMKPDGTPYTVFTPFSKRWHLNLTEENMASAPSESHLDSLHRWAPASIPSLESMGFEQSSISAPEAVISKDVLAKYADLRDVPSVQGTSRLSVHLRFGTMSIREAAKAGFKHSEKWLTELIWRDFYQHIMHAFPHSMKDAFRPQYDLVPWRHDDAHFERWTQGKTGYPLVDAGMRELLATGFMHNRVRMVVASFFLQAPALGLAIGNGTFVAHLLDFELASNVGGWQWAAGSGCDAPTSASSTPRRNCRSSTGKYEYVKQWVTEWEPRPTRPNRGPQNGPPTRHRHLQSGALCRFPDSTLHVPWRHEWIAARTESAGLVERACRSVDGSFFGRMWCRRAEGGSTWRGCHPDVARPR